MSDLATVITAWAAVHTIIGIHNLTVYARRPTDFESLAYATLSFGFALYCWQGALIVDATSVAEAAFATRLGFLAAALAVGSFVPFAALLFGTGGSRVVAAAIGWAVFGVFLDLAGLLFDAGGRALGAPYQEPQQTVLAAVWIAGCCGFLGWAFYHVIDNLRGRRDLRLLGLGGLCLALAAMHDQAVFLGVLSGKYWTEHATVPVTLIFSFMMVRRLAATEGELERRTAEVRASYLELQRAQQDLINKEQLAAVGELSAVIAHEIRNPLAILMNATSGLGRDRLSGEDRQTLLSILSEETERLRRLVNDLGSYAQPVAVQSVRLRLSGVLEREGKRAADEGRNGLTVRLSLRDDIDLVEVDPALLGRALASLIDNALQAMPAGGELSLRTEPAELDGEPAVALVVADEGEGMNALVRDKALDPFFTTRASGTGLGLAIVDRIVRAHRGALDIESDYGKGTVVRIVLPRAAELGAA